MSHASMYVFGSSQYPCVCGWHKFLRQLYKRPNDRTRCHRNRKPKPSPRPWQQPTTFVFIDAIMIAGPLAFDCNHRKTEGQQTRKAPQ